MMTDGTTAEVDSTEVGESEPCDAGVDTVGSCRGGTLGGSRWPKL